MQTLNTIPNQGTFGEAVAAMNTNFSLVSTAIGEVEYNTRKNKGLFPAAAALAAAVTPAIGDWALVGSSFPAAIYVCTTAGTWTDSGNTYAGDNVSLNNYATAAALATLSDVVTALQSTVGGHTTSIAKNAQDIGTHTQNIGDVEAHADTLDTVVTQQSTAIGDLQTDISHVKTRVAALEMSGGGGGSGSGLTIVSMSQAAYDALATKDPDTLYLTY